MARAQTNFSRIGLAIVISLIGGCGPSNSDPSGLVGKPAPSVSITPLRPAGDVKLSSFAGKVVLLDFWATWCGPCKMLMPHIQDMKDKYGPKGLVVIGVSNEQREVVADFKEQNPAYTYDFFLDLSADASKQFQATGLPTTVLIGKDGKVAFYEQGYDETVPRNLEDHISDLING